MHASHHHLLLVGLLHSFSWVQTTTSTGKATIILAIAHKRQGTGTAKENDGLKRNRRVG